MALPVRLKPMGGGKFRSTALGVSLAALWLLGGCYSFLPSRGGGQTDFLPPRQIDPRDIALPRGYRIEIVARNLAFPTGIAFDNHGGVYVTESGYSYGEVFATPRLVRIGANGERAAIAEGARNGPWNGVVYHEGFFYIAEGGVLEGGKILRVSPEGETVVLIEGLPSFGDHHTNGPAIGPDGHLYFGQGKATNSGVVGKDNKKFGWLDRHPDFHDVPGENVTLRGQNFETPDLVAEQENGRVKTGAFSPFGQETQEGQQVEGAVIASGSIVRLPLEGGEPKQVAWGFRNPFGLAFSPEGELYVTDNGYDNRGSRPVWGAPDLLWRVTPGLWYGWPDYAGGRPLTDPFFRPPGKPALQFLLQEHPNAPPDPVARLGVHSSSNGFDFSVSEAFGYQGDAFIAQFGDMAPQVNRVMGPVGFKVVRVDPMTGNIEDFAVNRGSKNGSASYLGTGGLERPVAVRFNPDGSALYVVDFGVMTVGPAGGNPRLGTGVIWRIVREEVQP